MSEENRKLQLEIQAKHKAAEAKAEEARKAEMLRLADERLPDNEKLLSLASRLETLFMPEMETAWGADLITMAQDRLRELANDLRGEDEAEG